MQWNEFADEPSPGDRGTVYLKDVISALVRASSRRHGALPSFIANFRLGPGRFDGQLKLVNWL